MLGMPKVASAETTKAAMATTAAEAKVVALALVRATVEGWENVMEGAAKAAAVMEAKAMAVVAMEKEAMVEAMGIDEEAMAVVMVVLMAAPLMVVVMEVAKVEEMVGAGMVEIDTAT